MKFYFAKAHNFIFVHVFQNKKHKEEANTLNEQFISVYAHERDTSVPEKGQAPFPDISYLNMSTAGVDKSSYP